MEEEVGRLKPFESKAKEREEAAGKSKQESERKIEELKKKNQELEAQTTDRFEKLEKELKQERSQRESAASKMAGNDEEVQKARDLAAQLDQVVHDREEELGFLKQQLEAQKQAYEAQFKAMQSRKAEPMTSSEEAKNLKAQVQSITAERETLKTQLAATAQVLNTHKNLMVRAQAELAEKRVRIAELEASAKGAGAASEPEEAPIEEEAPEEEIDYSHIGLVRFHETKAAILRQGSSNSICVELVAVGDRMMCATVNESLNPGATVSVTLEMSKFGSKVQASAQVHSQAILKLNKLYEVNLVFTKVSDEDRSRLRAALRYYYMSK
jgi:DNA repair exonuclease SbcCD ATPase subunit